MKYSKKFREFVLSNLPNMFNLYDEQDNIENSYLRILAKCFVLKKNYLEYQSNFDQNNEKDLSIYNEKLITLIYKNLYNNIGLNLKKEPPKKNISLDYIQNITSTFGLSPNDILLDSPLFEVEFENIHEFVAELKRKVENEKFDEETKDLIDNYICLAHDKFSGTRLYAQIVINHLDLSMQYAKSNESTNEYISKYNLIYKIVVFGFNKQEKEFNSYSYNIKADFDVALERFKESTISFRKKYINKIENIINYLYLEKQNPNPLNKIINSEFQNYDCLPASYKSFLFLNNYEIEEIGMFKKGKRLDKKLNDIQIKKNSFVVSH